MYDSATGLGALKSTFKLSEVFLHDWSKIYSLGSRWNRFCALVFPLARNNLLFFETRMKSTYVFIIVAIAIAKRNSWRFSSKGKNDRNQFTIYSVFSVYKDFCFSSPWAFFLQRVTGNIVIVYCFVCHKLYKAKKKKLII